MTRLPVGGVEQQLARVLRAYDRSEVDPIVCSLSDPGEIGQEIKAAGVPVIALGRLGHRFSLAIARDLARIMREHEITVVRTHQYHANMYGRIAARLAGVPCVVASVHNVYTRDRKFHRRLVNRFLARWSDRVVAVSEAVKADIVRYDGLSPDWVSVIYNGVDCDVYAGVGRAEARRELGFGADEIVVGSACRLHEQKGLAHLIDALAVLGKRGEKVTLALAGDGPARDALAMRARDAGVGDRVRFLGMRRDVPRVLAAIDIFAMPSLWEGLGTSLIEAMAAGKPVVVSEIPPFREIVTHGRDGLIVPVGDESALASAVESLMFDPVRARAMGEEAARTARERFGIGTTVRAYTRLYREVLAARGYSLAGGG
jgi:glycosyltransferase involved in cell wall biosynthesis